MGESRYERRNIVSSDIDFLKETERKLYMYPKLCRKVEIDERDIEDLKIEKVTRRAKDIMLMSVTGGIRLSDEERQEALIADRIASMERTVKEVRKIRSALDEIKNVVSNWENGLNQPDAQTIEILLDLFSVDANTLFGWNNPEQLDKDAEHMVNEILMNEKLRNAIDKISKMNSDDLDLLINFIDRLSNK